jgi:2,5-diamino-6-(ribosylamino)-4(3H)-pyrimidinone 5'-phosphate reductase
MTDAASVRNRSRPAHASPGRPKLHPQQGFRTVTPMAAPPLRPYVVLNMSMSADGKIASANRAVTTFGSALDLRRLYALRATADAVVCGATTVAETGATMTNGNESFRRTRIRRGLPEFPVRVVASANARLRLDLPLWKARGGPLIVVVGPDAPASRRKSLAAHGAIVWTEPRLCWIRVLERLFAEYGVRRTVLEGGGALNDAFFQEDLVDELRLTVCPILLGGGDAPTLADGRGFQKLADALRFRLTACERAGSEQFLRFKRVRPGTPRPAGKPDAPRADSSRVRARR